ncbi:MAG TPA: alpha/beta fold hydrolase, partial [Chitinophagaceae bacterium]|nr:alpha/beta fold hydrolase [Chitinophagaceae bacterium]
NIGAAFHAHKFSHFYNDPSLVNKKPSQNIFKKTWRLFAGQRYGKLPVIQAPVMPYDTVVLKTQNGLAIDSWYIAADSMAKGTVILFHGLTMNKELILPEANDFHYQGYNVLMVDFRAHGSSEGNTTTIGLREAEEVKLAYDYILAKGEKNIFCWGTSMGGVAIIKAISDYQLKPAGIILEMPFGSLQEHLRARARTIGFGGFPEKPFAFLVTFWMGVERGFNGFAFKTDHYAKAINCPVLMQWGRLDRLVLEKEITKILAAVPLADKKLVVYETADHESFLQKDPQKWRMETELFLSAHSR